MRKANLAAATVLALGLAGATVVRAQSTNTGPAPGSQRPNATGNSMSGTGMSGTGIAAPSGNPADHNPAIATSSASAATPAHGANSFTASEARSRIQSKGYSNVADLKKDNNGVWHGQAQKDGNTENVWLDYRGNVGQQ